MLFVSELLASVGTWVVELDPVAIGALVVFLFLNKLLLVVLAGIVLNHMADWRIAAPYIRNLMEQELNHAAMKHNRKMAGLPPQGSEYFRLGR